MEDHELLNAVTVWYIRAALTQPPQTWNGWFRDHPLLLRRHEQDQVLVDFSVLRVPLPLRLRQRGRTEAEEMLQPLAELCERVGEKMPAGEWAYDWYYLELLDRQERVAPLCWIDPELLYQCFPPPDGALSPAQSKAKGRQQRQSRVGRQTEASPWHYQLAAMDAVARGEVTASFGPATRQQWEDWLVRTWRKHEPQWLQEGQLTYETVLPWSKMLVFDPALLETDHTPARRRQKERPGGSPARLRSQAGYPGLYWQKIPLYDERSLPLIWHAMKEGMYVTSVFNPAAKQRQDPRLWQVLEARFSLPFPRLSHYRYLVRLREQKVLEWRRDEGKILTEIAKLLVDSGLHPLDPVEAARVRRKMPEEKQAYYASARRVAVRVVKRLRDEGLIQRGKPGRRPKPTQHNGG